MESKLARQMAYKKRLEQEYRDFQERCKYERRSQCYEGRVRDLEQWSYDEDMHRRRHDVRNGKTEQSKEELTLKQNEEKKKRLESFTVEKERLSKKREEYSKRASKFKELKRKRFEEKKRADEAKQLLSSEDMWEELDIVIRENDAALQGLKEYHYSIERLVKEQKAVRQRKKENRLSLSVTQTLSRSSSSSTRISNEFCDAELDPIYARIKELEESIVSLDFELEDYEMIKMREETNKVKRRMSEAVGGEIAVNLDSVDMFLRNDNLWERYKSRDKQMC